jgi:hypothetical protein
MFGMMIPMPKRVRPSWASVNLGTSKLREVARRVQQIGLTLRKSR